MKLGVVRELAEGEKRVALVPESAKKLSALGFKIIVEAGAGAAAHFPDAAYVAAGATVVGSAEEVLSGSEMLLKVGAPIARETDMMPQGSMLLTSLMPQRNLSVVRRLAARGVTCFSTDAIPRTTRAQAMDTLSSMASIVGFKGVLMAALALPRYTGMFTTAAGTIFPAKYFVIGAGVAGLQAIATAKRLGGNVFATDVRPEVKEQIESVGAKYVGVDIKHGASAGGGYAKELTAEDKLRQQAMLSDQCGISDVVVTTALIGGVFAPRLIPTDIVSKMKPGSVIMDLGAEGGGNCELSRPGTTVVHNGVSIIAPLNIPSMMASDASLLWSRNLTAFLTCFWKDKKFNLDWNDDILKGCAITKEGEVVHAKTREALEKEPKPTVPGNNGVAVSSGVAIV